MKKLLNKLTYTPDSWCTSNKERKSYYLYLSGQNMIYTMITSFLTTYLLFQGVDPVKSGTVMLIVKIWDAINDAVFGCIFDKAKFKSKQKFKRLVLSDRKRKKSSPFFKRYGKASPKKHKKSHKISMDFQKKVCYNSLNHKIKELQLWS